MKNNILKRIARFILKDELEVLDRKLHEAKSLYENECNESCDLRCKISWLEGRISELESIQVYIPDFILSTILQVLPDAYE